MLTLREQLQAYFRQHTDEWVPSGVIQRAEFKNKQDGTTYTPQNVGRTLRTMENGKSIAVTYYGHKKSARYKLLPTYLKAYYLNVTERKQQNTVDLFTISAEEVTKIREEARRKGYVV